MSALKKCFGPSPAQGHFLKEMLLWRHNFIILDDSENGKVQKVSPKGIYKGKLPWATIKRKFKPGDERPLLRCKAEFNVPLMDINE